MPTLFRDLAEATRALRRSPSTALLVVAVLGLAIGATATLWTAVDAVILRPLPFPQAEQLVAVSDFADGGRWTTTPSNFADYRREVASFDSFAAYSEATFALVASDGPAEQIAGTQVTAEFFPVLTARTVIGRALGPADEGQPTVLVGERLWRRRFASDPALVGSAIRLDGAIRTVVGVLAAEQSFPPGSDLWVPLAFSAEELRTQRGAHWLRTVGRLRNGADLDGANAELSAVAERLAIEYPQTNEGLSAIADPLHERIARGARPTLWLLFGAVGLALLAACANLASLTVARAVARASELAVRSSLGGAPRRLARILFAESLLLAAAGAALGCLLASGALRALPLWLPEVPRIADARFGLGSAVAAGLLAGLCALLLGLAPAIFALRRDPAQALRVAGRSLAGSHGAGRLRRGLVVATTLMALVLVSGAALLERSYRKLVSVDPGFRVADKLAFSISLPDGTYRTPEDGARFVAELRERLEALPGVRSTAAMFGQPVGDFDFTISLHTLDGRRLELTPDLASPQIRIVTPGYFATVGIPLVDGRFFTPADRHGAPPVVIASERAARLVFGDRGAVGHTLAIGTQMQLGRGLLGGEVVGVVGDVREQSLAGTPEPTLYFVHDQYPVGSLSFVVSAPRPILTGLVAPIREAVAAIDPELPVFRIRTFEELIADSIATRRLVARLFGGFALAASLFAALGLFGILQQSVTERRRELAVRSALGAAPRTVRRQIFGQALALTGIGIALGLVVSWPLSRFLRGMLYELSPTDPATLVTAAAILFTTAIAAAWAPAHRAGRLDPITALREE